MKTYSFIIPIILSILCLLYLLFYPCQETKTPEHDFTAKVLAKENEHNTISNALALSVDASYKEKIEAHEKCYYYVSGKKNIVFSINSQSIQHLKTDLLSDTGNHIPYQLQRKKNSLILSPSKKAGKTERIFLCLTNQSVSECSIQIQITTLKTVTPKPDKPTASNRTTTAPKTSKSSASNQATATPKTNKSSASNRTTAAPKTSKSSASSQTTAAPKTSKSSASNQTTAAPKTGKSSVSNQATATSKPDNTSSKHYKEAILQPQFLLLPTDSTQKIQITNYAHKNEANHFIWLSTNPNIATVKNGIITTHQKGTAIIYLKDKKHTNNTSSCLVRVIGREVYN